MPDRITNEFLPDLLALQQDGKGSISAPTNWTTQEPLLYVSTEVDLIINELIDTILLEDEKNTTARWHFFIGSPGNGKSAAVGKLAKRLESTKTCKVFDEEGISINDLEPTSIPYAINVFEGKNKFPTVQIVQDASVVRIPFSPDVDPALELINTIKHAWDKGTSLIICTNRGILEKAHRDNHMDPAVNSEVWFKLISAIVGAKNSLLGCIGEPWSFDTKRPAFKNVKISYSHLDNYSLLQGRDIFDQLLQKAINIANWEKCKICSSNNLCPFKANRDWLADEEYRKKILMLLSRAEVLSGQIIVFREALAIISLILAGCPRDYNNMHPCDWVSSRVSNGDIFSLAARRIYMSIFASYSPHGLDAVVELQQRQLESLTNLLGLLNTIGSVSTQASKAIEHVINGQSPSTDVGVIRLLSKEGIMASLDPWREAAPTEFYDRWDSDYDAITAGSIPCLTEIELTCISIWKELEESLELVADHSTSESYWAVRRWSSNFMLHLGALVEGYSAWAEELDKFATLLALISKPNSQRTSEDKRAIRLLNIQIENLLNAITEDQTTSTIKLSECVMLTGQWVRDKLKPKTVGSETSGSLSLAIEFEGGERAVFGAPIYLWLTRRASGRLDARCFPQELLAGIKDARVRAAAKGDYAFQDNDVELVIHTGNNGELFRLARFDGEVDVDNKSL